MGLIEIIGIGIALAMDAFSVSLCKGLKMQKLNVRHAFVIAFFFGAFQALMPLAGWLLGTRFESLITKWDHWIAFALLSIIGGKMLYESLAKKEDADDTCASDAVTAEATAKSAGTTEAYTDDACTKAAPNLHEAPCDAMPSAPKNPALDIKELFILAVATSIDALAVGITFAFLQVKIVGAATIIGAVTFAISFSGVIIGNFFGAKFKEKAEIAGGIILVAIGVKILLEHLGLF